jgi:hypothetical protein
MATIPPKKKRRFFEKKWIVEAATVVPPILAAIVAAWRLFLDKSTENLGWLSVAAAIWLTVGSVIKVIHAYQQDKEQKAKEDHEGLLGALHVVHANVARHCGFTDTDNPGRLRVTIHSVVSDRKSLEQVLPYVGGGGGPAGRTFDIKSGIAGRVAREGTPYTYSRQNNDYSAFVKELTGQWGYTEDEAKSLSHDRRSWMAVPLFHSNADRRVIAVIYLDSDDKDLFSDAVRTIVLNSCSGVASFVSERYK